MVVRCGLGARGRVRGGGRRQAAGGRRQAAGGRRQAAGGRRQAAGGRRQAAVEEAEARGRGRHAAARGGTHEAAAAATGLRRSRGSCRGPRAVIGGGAECGSRPRDLWLLVCISASELRAAQRVAALPCLWAMTRAAARRGAVRCPRPALRCRSSHTARAHGARARRSLRVLAAHCACSPRVLVAPLVAPPLAAARSPPPLARPAAARPSRRRPRRRSGRRAASRPPLPRRPARPAPLTAACARDVRGTTGIGASPIRPLGPWRRPSCVRRARLPRRWRRRRLRGLPCALPGSRAGSPCFAR